MELKIPEQQVNILFLKSHPARQGGGMRLGGEKDELRFVVMGEIAALLAHVHTEDNEHCKQGQGKKKCHLYSVLHVSSYTQPMKNHLRSS